MGTPPLTKLYARETSPLLKEQSMSLFKRGTYEYSTILLVADVPRFKGRYSAADFFRDYVGVPESKVFTLPLPIPSTLHIPRTAKFIVKPLRKNNTTLNEIQVNARLASIRSGSISKFAGFLETSSRFLLIMNNDGVSLDSLERKDMGAHRSWGTWILAPDRLSQLTQTIVDAVTKLRKAGVIHLDWKPRNIVWNAKKERFVVIDFGRAIRVYANEEGTLDYRPVGGTKPRFNGETPLHVLQHAALHQFAASCPSAVRQALQPSIAALEPQAKGFYEA
jgi:serine/threonine protein kinase